MVFGLAFLNVKMDLTAADGAHRKKVYTSERKKYREI